MVKLCYVLLYLSLGKEVIQSIPLNELITWVSSVMENGYKVCYVCYVMLGFVSFVLLCVL